MNRRGSRRNVLESLNIYSEKRIMACSEQRGPAQGTAFANPTIQHEEVVMKVKSRVVSGGYKWSS